MYGDLIHNTKDLIFKEMEKINAKGDISATDLCNLNYASKTLLNLEKFEAMEDYGEDASFTMGRRSMRTMPHYEEESWRRGRGSDGRFVSRGMGHAEPRHYEDGYSGHSIEDKTIMMLEHQMDNATSDYDRQFIQNQIRAIREKQMK